MQIIARNVLRGTGNKIVQGAVNSEVTLELAGGQEITAVITKASVERLKLAQGKTAYAVIKASDVMIGVD